MSSFSYRVASTTSANPRGPGPQNKRMQLTKLRAAPVLRAEVPPCAPVGRTDGGTASQLIASVGRTNWERGVTSVCLCRRHSALAVSFSLAVFCAVGCRGNRVGSPEWRRTQEVAIASAILADLAAMPPDQHDPTDLRHSFCVFVGQDRSGYHDPAPAVVAALRQGHLDVYPMSQCGKWVVSATGTKATFLGVVSVQWTNDEIVVAEGERLLGILAGNTWRYTLSRTGSRWQVDTVKVEKVF
jgi:hypothetical protein